jgi:4-carboxymuconolactone decarboxylase
VYDPDNRPRNPDRPAYVAQSAASETGDDMKVLVTLFLLCFAATAIFGQSESREARPRVSADQRSAIDPQSGSRLPLLDREDMRDEAGAQIYDTLAGPNGEPPRGTIAIALYSPRTALVLSRIDEYLRHDSALGTRAFELLSLVASREMNLPWEWSVHERAALRAGLEPAVIDVVRTSGAVAGLSDYDALLVRFGRQLFRNRHVNAELFSALRERAGRRETFDVIMVLSYHALAGILQRAVDQRPPPDWNPDDLPAVAGVGTPGGRPGEFVDIGPRPPLPADLSEDSYYRLPLLRRAELDARGRAIFDRVLGSDTAIAPRGPVGMTLNSPALVLPVQELNTLLRVSGVLSRRTAEIVIAATGREMNSQYQWAVHGAAAQRAGAGRQVLDAIRNDAPLSGLDAADAAVIAFTRELFREQTVRPETFAAAESHFGTRGVVEIAELVGDYLMMTTVYNALGMRLGPDRQATLPHRAGAPVGAEWK